MRTMNESKVVLRIVKDIEQEYNANNISKVIKISSMGALKILKKLEKDNILVSRKLANISFYNINFENSYAFDYVEFLLKDEAEHSSSYIRRWVSEIRRIKEAEISVIFGSVLRIGDKAKDIDVLFVVKKENFDKLRNEIEKLNQLNDKKIHPIYQTEEDFRKNLIKKDLIILESIKGIVVFGYKIFLEILKELK